MTIWRDFSDLSPLQRAWVRLRTLGVAGWFRAYRGRLRFVAYMLCGLICWQLLRILAQNRGFSSVLFATGFVPAMALALVSRWRRVKDRNKPFLSKQTEYALLVGSPIVALAEISLTRDISNQWFWLLISSLTCLLFGIWFVNLSILGSEAARMETVGALNDNDGTGCVKFNEPLQNRAIRMVGAGLCPACEKPIMPSDADHSIGCALCGAKLYGWCAEPLCGVRNLRLYKNCSACGKADPVGRAHPWHPIEREYAELDDRKRLKAERDTTGNA